MVIKKLENACMTIASSSVCLTSINGQLEFLLKAAMTEKGFQFQIAHPILKLKVKGKLVWKGWDKQDFRISFSDSAGWFKQHNDQFAA